MENKKNEKLVKVVITIVVIAVLIWFIIINPLLKFKSMEKEMLYAGERYFEINTSLLPTGNKIKKVSLETLYNKDFILEDLRAPYTNKYCDPENSWVRVSKVDNEYKYNVYLECGMFRSKTDHKGPEIKLKGNEEVIVYQGEKYKDAGIESVIDDTDGKMNVSQVKVDSSEVNTDKVGTYKVTYKISDSLENKTEKVRTVKVVQTLNNIIRKNAGKSKVYKGLQTNNYVMIDGITFKVVSENGDGSVKIVSMSDLGSVDYEGLDSWLNDYFYEKLSDNAKEYIVKSKWCNEKVSNSKKYTKCDEYGKKKYVGLLSVADYNNAIDSKGISNLENDTAIWTASPKNSKNAWVTSYYNMVEGERAQYKEFSKDEIFNVKPALNIKKDATIVDGTGTMVDPFILKGNANKYKKGSKISSLKTGTYISYSGYTWRVIGKESDNTTKVIMTDPLNGPTGNFYTVYDKKITAYNPSRKENLGYVITNKTSEYIKTDYFVSKNVTIKTYTDKVLYNKEKSEKTYKAKLVATSVFDLYGSNRSDGVTTWYRETSNNKNYVNSPTLGITSIKFDSEETNGIKLTGYINENVVIKSGTGTIKDPITLTK